MIRLDRGRNASCLVADVPRKRGDARACGRGFVRVASQFIATQKVIKITARMSAPQARGKEVSLFKSRIVSMAGSALAKCV